MIRKIDPDLGDSIEDLGRDAKYGKKAALFENSN
jgi:hypothetical protein